MSTKTLKKRLSDATTRLVELEYVEAAMSIEISLPHRHPSCLPRLVDEVEALVKLIEHQVHPMRPWVEAEDERVETLARHWGKTETGAADTWMGD
jgi:hypothetical protein